MKTKVWNDNRFEHVEDYKGDKIRIPPGGFIEMEYEDARQFAGQFTGIAKKKTEDYDGLGGIGAPDPKFFKMIRVDHVNPELIFPTAPLVNHLDGKAHATQEALLIELRKARAENPEKAIADQDGKEVAELKKGLAELTKQLEDMRAAIPKRGRPKKEAVA